MKDNPKKEASPREGEARINSNNGLVDHNYAPTPCQEEGSPSLSIEELRQRYAATQGAKEEYQKRLSEASLQALKPWEKQVVVIQRIKLFRFLDLLEEIFRTGVAALRSNGGES
jgi:hypothetical protein